MDTSPPLVPPVGLRPREAVTHATDLPIVLTRVSRENPAIAALSRAVDAVLATVDAG